MKHSLKKSLALLLCAAAILTLLSGCGAKLRPSETTVWLPKGWETAGFYPEEATIEVRGRDLKEASVSYFAGRDESDFAQGGNGTYYQYAQALTAEWNRGDSEPTITRDGKKSTSFNGQLTMAQLYQAVSAIDQWLQEERGDKDFLFSLSYEADGDPNLKQKMAEKGISMSFVPGIYSLSENTLTSFDGDYPEKECYGVIDLRYGLSTSVVWRFAIAP